MCRAAHLVNMHSSLCLVMFVILSHPRWLWEVERIAGKWSILSLYDLCVSWIEGCPRGWRGGVHLPSGSAVLPAVVPVQSRGALSCSHATDPVQGLVFGLSPWFCVPWSHFYCSGSVLRDGLAWCHAVHPKTLRRTGVGFVPACFCSLQANMGSTARSLQETIVAVLSWIQKCLQLIFTYRVL